MALEVEVVYALPGRVDEVRLRLADGATLRDAVRASGLLQRHPDLTEPLRLGVFGEAKRPESAARPGDRIEIYRPLAVDPKEARRKRARRPKK